jgi:hypothetical protein
MKYSVEGRTKLYFSTTKTSDELLATLTVTSAKKNVDVEAIIHQSGFIYPDKSIYLGGENFGRKHIV